MKIHLSKSFVNARVCEVLFVAGAFIANASIVRAVNVDITLSTNPPTISSELSGYLAANFGGIHRVGFSAADIGQGAGDGLNEIVAFSFDYDPILLPIASATLALDLTKPSIPDTSDSLFFADNGTPITNDVSNPYYGNASLGSLSPDSSTVVTIDLKNVSTNPGFLGVFGSQSLESLLVDGELNIVYADDATIHSARLTINLVPEPRTLLLGVVAGVVCLLPRGRRA